MATTAEILAGERRQQQHAAAVKLSKAVLADKTPAELALLIDKLGIDRRDAARIIDLATEAAALAKRASELIDAQTAMDTAKRAAAAATARADALRAEADDLESAAEAELVPAQERARAAEAAHSALVSIVHTNAWLRDALGGTKALPFRAALAAADERDAQAAAAKADLAERRRQDRIGALQAEAAHLRKQPRAYRLNHGNEKTRLRPRLEDVEAELARLEAADVTSS
jgi:fused signal recognition particle receptor